MARRFAALLIGLMLIVATGLGMGLPSGTLADASYSTCPSFDQFQTDAQAISSGTITFVAANCTLDATSTIFIQANSNVTIDGNGLTLSGGTAGTPGDFNLFEIETPNGSLTLDHVTVEYGAYGIAWTGKPETTTVTLTDSTVSNNNRSGILANGNVSLTNSTVSGNGNSGIIAGGTVTVTNSTITGNSMAGVSGAGQLTLTYSTITDNGDAGVDGTHQAFLATILAGNGSNCSDYDVQTDEGYNVSTDTSCFFTATGAQDDIDISNLHLGVLSDNGGPTLTIPLSVDSSAVDAIPTTTVDTQTYCIDADLNPIDDPATSEAITTDQRGITRPQRSGCDIGAFELDATDTTTAASSANTSDAATSITLSATVTADSGTVNQGTVTFHVTDSGGAPIGTDVQSGTVTDGAASASFTPTSLAPGSYTITASYHDPSGDFRDSSNTNTLTVTAGLPDTVTFAPGDTSATTGGSVTETATITDSAGYPVADGTAVQWTITGPTSSSASITHQDTSTSSGEASLTYSNTASGVDTVTVVAGTTPDTASNSASVTWNPGTTSSAALAPGDDSATAGSSITETVTVKDSNGNLVADGTPVQWSITGATSNTASISQQDTTTTNGQASLTYTNTASGMDTVTVVAGTDPDTATTSATVTWIPGDAALVTLTPGDTVGIVGGTVTETATVTDLQGNPVTDGTTVTFTVAGSNPTSGSATTVNGQASFHYSGTLTGTDTLTVTASGGTTPSTSATITWTAPSSTKRASLTIVSPFSPSIVALVQTGTKGGTPAGTFSFGSRAVSLSQVQLTSLVVNGSQATLYGTATVNGSEVTFRLDVTAGRVTSTVRLRLSDGYDSEIYPPGGSASRRNGQGFRQVTRMRLW